MAEGHGHWDESRVGIYLPIAELSVNLFVLLAMGAAVGFLSGMFGVGGGFLITPLLIFYNIPPAIAVATGANQVIASSFSGTLAHMKRGTLDFKLGTVLLGERLSWRGWTAVGIAAAGIALLLGGAVTTLWISLTLALSFGTYGILRKRVPVGAIPGLTIESLLLLVPAIGMIVWYAVSP